MTKSHQPDIAVVVKKRMREELVNRSPAAAIVYILAGQFFGWQKFGVVQMAEVMFWAGVLITSTNVVRLISAKIMQKRPIKFFEKLFRLHTAVIALSSVGWGIMFAASTIERSPEPLNLVITYFVMCAVSMGSITSLSFVPVLFFFFQFSTVVLPGILLMAAIWHGDAPSNSVMLVASSTLLLLYNLSQSRVIRKNYLMRFEYEELLGREKVELQSTVESLRKTRHDLDVQRAKAQNSAKFAALGEMAGGVAHEINNPLAIITGHVHHIQMKAEEAADTTGATGATDIRLKFIYEKSGKVIQAVDRIAGIIRGLRSFSRQADQDPFVKSSLRQIVDDTLSFSRQRLTGGGVNINVNVDPNIEFECRSTQISQVLLNLLNNAADAVKGCSKKEVTIEGAIVGDSILLSVEDTGAGVPADIAGKVFEPFFTTKDIGQGAGLGLSVSKGIVEDHNGEIALDRTRPSRFTIRIPRVHVQTKPVVAVAA